MLVFELLILRGRVCTTIVFAIGDNAITMHHAGNRLVE